MTIRENVARLLVVCAVMTGVFGYYNNYYKPYNFKGEFTSCSIYPNEVTGVPLVETIELDLIIKRRIFADDIVTGSAVANGIKYEVWVGSSTETEDKYELVFSKENISYKELVSLSGVFYISLSKDLDAFCYSGCIGDYRQCVPAKTAEEAREIQDYIYKQLD